MNQSAIQDRVNKGAIILIIRGKVYDVSKFAEEHPGGKQILIEFNGQDATDQFIEISHSDSAQQIMQKYLLGPRMISEQEFQQHSKSLWIKYANKVYDVTKFKQDHPGGDKILTLYANQDVTAVFDNVQHSKEARTLMKKYYVGDMEIVKKDNTVKKWSVFLLGIIVATIYKSVK